MNTASSDVDQYQVLVNGHHDTHQPTQRQMKKIGKLHIENPTQGTDQTCQDTRTTLQRWERFLTKKANIENRQYDN